MTAFLNGPLIDTAVVMAFVSSILFVVGYTRMAPWWRYAVGRAMVSLDAVITFTLLPGVLHLVFHINTADAFFAWYRVISLFAVAGTTLWRLYTVHRVQAAESDRLPVEEGKAYDSVRTE
jgi:hypothetical protein